MVYQLPIKSTLHMVCLAMNYYYQKKNIFISFFTKSFYTVVLLKLMENQGDFLIIKSPNLSQQCIPSKVD